MGQYYFSAEKGTIYSSEALQNPDSTKITIESNLLPIQLLENVITDTHFSERNREGRLLSFMANTDERFNTNSIGIGVDESTSLIVEDKRMLKTGRGNVYIYRQPISKQQGLNLGPIYRHCLSNNEVYPPLQEIREGYTTINVINGEIK